MEEENKKEREQKVDKLIRKRGRKTMGKCDRRLKRRAKIKKR